MSISNLTNTTWVWGALPSNVFTVVGDSWYINFTSNSINYTILDQHFDEDFDLGKIMYNSTNVFNVAYGDEDGVWENEVYKTITITGGTDVTNAELIAFLETNATLQGGGLPSVEYDLTNLHLTPGVHSLTVIARATNCRDSDPTAAISYTAYGQIDTPIAVLNPNGYDFAWTAVAHAATYEIEVKQATGGRTWSIPGLTVPPTYYDLRNCDSFPNFTAGAYKVRIKAIGEQYYHDSAFSTAVDYYKLAAPTGLSINDLTATFNAVTNATSYGLYSDTSTLIGSYTPADLTQATVTVDLTTLSNWSNITLGTHTLTVKAQRSGAMDSPASSGVTFLNADQLDPPQNLRAVGTEVSFDEVEHAEQYEVFLDGVSGGTFNGPIDAPIRNDVNVESTTVVTIKSSFVEDAEEYEYILDGESVGTEPLAFTVYAVPSGAAGSGSNCAVYAKANSDTVSTTDYTWYVESNGTMHGTSTVDNVTKVAIMSSVAQGNAMASLGLEGYITQSLTPVVVKLHGSQSLGLIYFQT